MQSHCIQREVIGQCRQAKLVALEDSHRLLASCLVKSDACGNSEATIATIWLTAKTEVTCDVKVRKNRRAYNG